MGSKALDVTLVEELASFEEVRISFFQLTPFDLLVLLGFLIILGHLSISRVDKRVGVPETSFDILLRRIFEIEKYSGLASGTESETDVNRCAQVQNRVTYPAMRESMSSNSGKLSFFFNSAFSSFSTCSAYLNCQPDIRTTEGMPYTYCHLVPAGPAIA